MLLWQDLHQNCSFFSRFLSAQNIVNVSFQALMCDGFYWVNWHWQCIQMYFFMQQALTIKACLVTFFLSNFWKFWRLFRDSALLHFNFRGILSIEEKLAKTTKVKRKTRFSSFSESWKFVWKQHGKIKSTTLKLLN